MESTVSYRWQSLTMTIVFIMQMSQLMGEVQVEASLKVYFFGILKNTYMLPQGGFFAGNVAFLLKIYLLKLYFRCSH